MSRKVLFLDVDGVLNHSGLGERWREDGHRTIDPDCAARVLRIHARTGCEVVLSSTWRLGADGLRAVNRALLPLRVRDVTPYDGTFCARHLEISSWLRHNPVSAYAILDDDNDADIPGHFVQTDFCDGGLRDEHVERVVAILGDEIP